MSDELRVELRTAFRDNQDERDPRVLERLYKDGDRMKKMMEIILQDAFFRMYPTVRPYHTWSGLSRAQLMALKEPATKPK